MLINIRKSRIFDTNPAKRFADKYNVPEELWTEIWKRYKLLQYDIADLADYFHFKAGQPIKRRYIKRWLFLTEIYTRTKHARDMGVQIVNTEIFGTLEAQVINEVTRHMKNGSTQDSNIIV
jgi:hypothetical protein